MSKGQSVEDRLKELEEEVKDLREFKQKVEVGSWLIRCTAYTIGGLVVFITGMLTIFEKWPFR
jgi:Flp pilus assembly protein TadB